MVSRAPITWTTVTLDCSDAEALALFYAHLFGWEINARDGAGWVQLRDPHGGIGLNLQAERSYEPPMWPEQPGQQALRRFSGAEVWRLRTNQLIATERESG
jgi:hypothetical protein